MILIPQLDISPLCSLFLCRLMSGEYVDNFCKNIFDVSHVCARSLTEEDKGVNTEEVDMQVSALIITTRSPSWI